jgi:cation-transporting ATPase 13A1
MIEFSQQTVSGDAWETGLALLILFIFAIIASGYVLKEGLRKKEKTTHEILLKCVIIITSVVPRQFPMQASGLPSNHRKAHMTLPFFVPQIHCNESATVPA